MGINASLYDFKRTYKKKWAWPKYRFTGVGPKLTVNDIDELPFEISDEHAALLLWKNGGTPQQQWFCSKGRALKIDCFFGIGTDDDLGDAILSYRNELPRFSIPIAVVENNWGDTSLLLSFPFDNRAPGKGREKKVWFYSWFHEEDPNDEELESYELVTSSILRLVTSLKESPPKKYKPFDGGNLVDDNDDDDDF